MLNYRKSISKKTPTAANEGAQLLHSTYSSFSNSGFNGEFTGPNWSIFFEEKRRSEDPFWKKLFENVDNYEYYKITLEDEERVRSEYKELIRKNGEPTLWKLLTSNRNLLLIVVVVYGLFKLLPLALFGWVVLT